MKMSGDVTDLPGRLLIPTQSYRVKNSHSAAATSVSNNALALELYASLFEPLMEAYNQQESLSSNDKEAIEKLSHQTKGVTKQ